MSEPFIGEIILFAGNYAPRGWAFCHGQLLAISQNSALFSILGTTYGGDGRTTFALPDTRSRVVVSPGTGPGLRTYRLGEKAGSENVTPHSHGVSQGPEIVPATADEGNQVLPDATRRLSAAKLSLGQDFNMYTASAPNTELGGLGTTGSLGTQNTGGGGSHANIQPYQAINYIIALVGIYPSRN